MRFLLVSHNVFEWTVSQIFLDEQCIIVYISTDILLFFFDGITFWYVRNVKSIFILFDGIYLICRHNQKEQEKCCHSNEFVLIVCICFISGFCLLQASKYATLLVEVLVLGWGLCLFRRSGKSTLTGCCLLSLCSHRQRSQIQLSSLTCHPFCSPACWECWWVHGVG